MTEAIKKIVEGIDSRDVSAIAENFTAAIKDRILDRIVEESKKSFDKKVEEIEGDGESDADGEEESDDDDNDDDDDSDESKKKVNESVKVGKPETLAFGRVIDLNSAEKSKASVWTKEVYDSLVKKFGKTAESITAWDSVRSKGVLDIHTGTKNKNAKHISIKLIGGYAQISKKTEFSNKVDTTYAKIG